MRRVRRTAAVRRSAARARQRRRWTFFSSLLGLIVVMLVAIVKVHWKHGFFVNWSLTAGKGHGIEMSLALIGMALAVLVGGAGAFSIDRLIAPR